MKKIYFNIKFNSKIAIFLSATLFFLYLLYLSIPSLYDTGRVQKVLYNKLGEEFGLNLSLSSNITYRILPQPHFYIKDSKIFQDKTDVSNEIGEAKDLKIFISQKNLFNKKNIKIKKIVISKGNFFFNRQNINFVTDLFKKKFSKKKIIIKKSKLFFNDKNGTIMFIYSINHFDYFKNDKKNKKQIETQGSLFKLPIQFTWEKDLNTQNTISNFKADKIDINFVNKGFFSKGKYNYENTLNIMSNIFKTKYEKFNNDIVLNSKKSLIKNTPINYTGNIELSPFSLQIFIDAKEIDINYFFKNTILFNEIISSNILINDNINGLIKIKSQNLNNSKFFNIADINFNFQEGEINLNNSFLINDKFGKLIIKDTIFEINDAIPVLRGELSLRIFDINQFYKFFPVSKKKRLKRKFNKINFNFTLNLISSKFSIDRINFLGNKDKIVQSKDVDNFVEDNYEVRFDFSNNVLFKNFMKKVITAYLDEG